MSFNAFGQYNYKGKNTTREPFDDLLPGDIIKWGPRKTLRKVRGISQYTDGRVWMITFAIRRPSWTRRPYTVYTLQELRKYFRGKVLEGSKLCSNDPIECLVQQEIEARSFADRYITAKEMAGSVL